MKKDSSKFGRRYDREYKENAVTLVKSGRPLSEVSRDLGISYWALSQWIKKSEAGSDLSETKTLSEENPEQREIRRLRQENEYLRRQRDILKKACGSEPRKPRATQVKVLSVELNGSRPKEMFGKKP